MAKQVNRRMSLVMILLVGANLVTLYFLFRAQRELWLWQQNGAAWPIKAGAADARLAFQSDLIHFLKVQDKPPYGKGLDQEQGYPVDVMRGEPESGRIFRTSQDIYVGAFNRKMRDLLANEASGLEVDSTME